MTKEQFENNFTAYSNALGEWIKLHGNLDVTKEDNRNKLYEFYKSL